MWNEPTKNELCKMPGLYSTEQINMEDKQVFMKFFLGAWTWYVTEVSHKDWNRMFGFVVSPLCPEGEWGYISLDELKSINVKGMEVDRDLHTATPDNPMTFQELKGGENIE